MDMNVNLMKKPSAASLDEVAEGDRGAAVCCRLGRGHQASRSVGDLVIFGAAGDPNGT